MHIRTRLLTVLGAALVGWSCPSAHGQSVSINVNAAANRRSISPQVYGVCYGGDAAAMDRLNSPLNRRGSDRETRYNWAVNATNVASDWYFESLPYDSPTAGEYYDSFEAMNRAAGADSMVTVPLLGWVARLGLNRSPLASFSIARYGAQTDEDASFPDAGNGILQANGRFVTGNDPNDAHVPSTSAFQRTWVEHMVARWGRASAGGVRYYLMDNEPSLWHQIHRDVHPVGETLDEIRSKTIEYASMVKAVDPSAQVVGPEEWGWDGYFESGYDQQYAEANNYQGPYPDRAAHGGMDAMSWLLDQMRRSEQQTGQRLLDVFSLHFYPQGGEFSDDTSAAMQQLRNRSTRALWDSNYVDQSWIGTPVNLIPRMRAWVNTYYPGTRLGLTEYCWGADGDMNGATAQADILGILGREGVDVACRWEMPAPATPTYKAIQMYRNYDGANSTFGDVSVQATVPDPDTLSAFAAVRSLDGSLTVMVINKSAAGPAQASIYLGGFAAGAQAQVWQLTSANAIAHLAPVAVQSSRISASVPARSITLFVVPAGAPAAATFASTATATPARVAPGAAVSLSATVTCTAGSVPDGIVDVEVYSAAGARVAQRYWTLQSFTTGLARTYAWAWTAPVTAGTYSVRVGVFTANWASSLHWNAAAGTVVVAVGDLAQYNFEAGTQTWTSSGGMIASVSSSAYRAFAGTRSLAVAFNGASAQTQSVRVAAPSTPAGRVVTFHVWIPAGSRVTWIQPYVQQGAGGGWRWTGTWRAMTSLTAGAWNTVTVTVPSMAVTPLYQLGVEFTTNGPWVGTCYVDSVGW